jgi:acetylornithine deacetylase
MSTIFDRETELREFTEQLLRFRSISGDEAAAADWLDDRLDALGFETYEWTAEAADLAADPSFPDDPAEITVADRPSVAGVLEFGDPDAGPTVTLNGHFDVVPVDERSWSSPPFEPTWDGDDLIARGAADMKSGLAAAVFAALALRDAQSDFDGRVVVECVAGEEDGGIGTVSGLRSPPFPFDRDAAIVTEPTELRPVVATGGSLMMKLSLTGRSAHAATPWRGESVLDHFERIRRAFKNLERERAAAATHPLYREYATPWPIVFSTVEAGSWESSVPAELEAELRLGTTMDETADETEEIFRDRLDEVVADNEWLAAHPPEFERFSVQFEPAETDPDEPVVRAVIDALADHGYGPEHREPRGVTYGADSRHYVAAGIPTVLCGPGTVEQAHYPDERIHWPEVVSSVSILADAVHSYLSDAGS